MASTDLPSGNCTGNDKMKTSILGQDASLVPSEQGHSQDLKKKKVLEVESSGYEKSHYVYLSISNTS